MQCSINGSLMKAHCNDCGGIRNHDVMCSKEKKDSDGDVWEIENYNFIKCCGCESFKLLVTSQCSEVLDEHGNLAQNEIYYPPSISRQPPKWFNNLRKKFSITSLVNEIYRALQNDAPALAVLGIRAAIESVMIEKIGDQGSFSKNLKEFEIKGHISKDQSSFLATALELGHATIHRNFIPEKGDVEFALDILEILLQNLYVLGEQAKETGGKIPKRSKSIPPVVKLSNTI